MDEFLQRMGELFECVLFTASLAKVFIIRLMFQIDIFLFYLTVLDFMFDVMSDLFWLSATCLLDALCAWSHLSSCLCTAIKD